MISQKYIASLVVATVHFLVCMILGVIVFFASLGYSIDSYESPAGWLVIIDHALLFLEAPVAVMLYWIYHPAPRFEPPHYFVADFLSTGSNFALVLGLCALWSLAFGCLVVFVKHWVRRLAEPVKVAK